jgi:sarcosine oxidase
MSADFDVAVVGGGVMGCAAALACAERGRRTVLFEQFGLGNLQGSSHGPSRIIRLAYHDPVYIPLAQTSFADWAELESRTEAELFHRTGGIDLADHPDDDALADRRDAMTAAGVAFSELDAAALRAEYPQFTTREGMTALYQCDTGILAADRCVRALASEASRHGAVLRLDTRVEDVRPDGHGVMLRTAFGSLAADRVILAPGAWAPRLLRSLGLELPLRVTREQVTVLAPSDPPAFAPGRFPIFIHHRGHEPLVSGFPCYGIAGVKLMFDVEGPEIDADHPDRRVNQQRVADMGDYAADLLPGLTREVVDAVSCLYTHTPDGDFIIDLHPEHAQLVVVSACSGHGFKFAPVIGRIAHDLAFGGESRLSHDRFSIHRHALTHERSAR